MKMQVASVLLLLSFFAHAEEKIDVKVLKAEYKRPSSVPYLPENPYSKEKEILGKALFFDPRLSGTNSMSCASCHNPSFAWGDSLPKAVGKEQKVLGRKTPTVLNLAWTERMMWDGRFKHFEGQALGPIGSPDEMNMDINKLSEKIMKIEGYAELFEKAFPGQPISTDLIAKSLAVYQRGIVSGISPFDKWIKGDEKAISENAKKGFVLFNTKANCMTCHSGWRFTDDSFQDVGLSSDDIGRGKFMKLSSQQHAFKTPGLRNIAQRAPYMHDGSKETLLDVVNFYSKGGESKRESLSEMIKPFDLSEEEKLQLVEFLKTLTSKDKAVELPILPVTSIK